LPAICIQAIAQAGDGTLIHLDKPYYVAGETVYYKLYFPKAFKSSSPMLELLVYNGEGTLVNKSYLKKEERNFVNGHYKIPFEAEPGIYHLVVGCLIEVDQQTITIAQVPLAIYGEEVPQTEDDSGNAKSYPNSIELDSELAISIQLQKRQYNPREEVTIFLAIHDRQGSPVSANMSLSVTDIGIIGPQESYPHSSLYQASWSLEPTAYLSEYIPVTGKLENQKEGQLLTFFMPSSNKIFYTTSEADGNFQLLVPGFYGEKTLQYIGEFSDGTPVGLKEQAPISTSSQLVYPATVLNYLYESKKRKLIYQLFNKVEGTYRYEIPEPDRVSAPDREFQASDYPFENLPSFCKELSTPLKYEKDHKGGFNFRMFNPESRNFFFGTPLFIVDGQMTKDVTYLSSLDFQKIERISLYYDNQGLANNFGFAGFSGVVMIYSKEQNLKVPQSPTTQVFQINGLQPSIILDSEPLDSQDKEPLFKPQLLWNPSLDTNADGQLEISFQQSDDISEFQIEVVVQSEDGRRGHGRLEYRTIDNDF